MEDDDKVEDLKTLKQMTMVLKEDIFALRDMLDVYHVKLGAIEKSVKREEGLRKKQAATLTKQIQAVQKALRSLKK